MSVESILEKIAGEMEKMNGYLCKLESLRQPFIVPEVSQEELIWREKAENIKVFTTHNPVSIQIQSELALVFGNSSMQAFWGLSSQANRLSRAYEVALQNLKYDAAVMEADAVIGVSFALNNSTGSGATLITGSSEAVMLLGTAVKTK
jgi:uncharacterized protein YbjQ (UPF0145 family)